MTLRTIRCTRPNSRRRTALAMVIAVNASLLAWSAGALAQENGAKLSISGYGTLGIVRSGDDQSDYLTDAFKPTGPGYTRRWSMDVDSRIGAQATVEITPSLSAIVQVISQQRFDDSYTPSVEWANLKYQVTPDISIRAGRIVLPIFLLNDSRKLGYANPWVRPPVEVYSQLPLTSSDGVDASCRLSLGESTNTLQATYGRSNSRFPGAGGSGVAKVRDLYALVDTIEYGFFTARVSYAQSRLTIASLDPLFDAFRQFGPPGAAIADKYAVNDKRVTFVGVGVGYDPGKWFAMGEWAKFNTDSVIGGRSAWYLSGGYRLDKFTPYLTYANLNNDGATSDPGLPLTFLPPQAAGAVAALNANLNGLLASIAVQKTVSIGSRWDLARSVAVKLQYDQVRRGSGSPGTFGNLQPGFKPGGKANVLSATVDFVF